MPNFRWVLQLHGCKKGFSGCISVPSAKPIRCCVPFLICGREFGLLLPIYQLRMSRSWGCALHVNKELLGWSRMEVEQVRWEVGCSPKAKPRRFCYSSLGRAKPGQAGGVPWHCLPLCTRLGKKCNFSLKSSRWWWIMGILCPQRVAEGILNCFAVVPASDRKSQMHSLGCLWRVKKRKQDFDSEIFAFFFSLHVGREASSFLLQHLGGLAVGREIGDAESLNESEQGY